MACLTAGGPKLASGTMWWEQQLACHGHRRGMGTLFLCSRVVKLDNEHCSPTRRHLVGPFLHIIIGAPIVVMLGELEV